MIAHRIIVILLLVILAQSCTSVHLSELYTANDSEFFPISVIPLPDTSVILVFGANYYLRELGLHPSVLLPSAAEQRLQVVVLVARVFRKSGYVVWARALARYDFGLTAVLSNSSEIVVTGYGRFTQRTDAQAFCYIAVSNGALNRCTSSRAEGVSMYALPISTGYGKLLMPGVYTESQVPVVAVLDADSGKYDDVIPLTGGGKMHAEDYERYGAFDKSRNDACFLTSTRGPYNERGSSKYDLFVHCFNLGENKNQRVKFLGNMPTYRTPRFARVEVANGLLFVAFERTRYRGTVAISQLFIHKFDSTTLNALPWIKRTGLAIPRIIQMPGMTDISLEPDSKVRSLEYVPGRNGGLAVLIDTPLNVTGQYTTFQNRIIMEGSSTLDYDAKEKWMVFIGDNRRVKVMGLPRRIDSKVKPNPIPRPWGKLLIGDTSVSKSGRKIIIYGTLQLSPPRYRSGPLFTYDVNIPYGQF